MTEINKKQYIADVRVMNYLLQAIPNDIHNSVDASKEGESLESVYEILTTLVNIMDRNNILPIPMSINTKFLDCLQPEWSKYVTMIKLVLLVQGWNQYIQMIDFYSLWNHKKCNAPLITKVIKGVETTIAPTTAEEKFLFSSSIQARALQNHQIHPQFSTKTTQSSKLYETIWMSTILNTLDSLGKFDGKSDEGSLLDILCVVMLLGTSEENSQECIVMPIWKDTSYFDSPTKDVDNDDSSIKDVNAAGQHVNTGSLKLNVVGPLVNTASSNKHDSPEDMFTMGVSSTLEATHIESFSDEDEPEVDLGNITNSYTVPTTPNTRIHKDHPIDNVIGDVKSTVQTRVIL
ncbi:hypothetical protein Tco_0368201 [Tanacetum coccineum]